PRAMSVVEAAAAAPLLAEQLERHEDGTVRYKILRALVKLRRQNPGVRLDERALQRAAERTLEHATELQGWATALSAGSDEAPTSIAAAGPLRAAHHLLVDLVRDKEAHATERLFLVLELVYR